MNILQLPNAVFLVGLIVQCAIRRHFVQRTKSEKKTVRQFDRTEKILLAAMFPPVLLLTRQKKGVAQSNNYKQENANERRPGHAVGRGAGLPSSAESARDVHCRASQRCAAGLPTGIRAAIWRACWFRGSSSQRSTGPALLWVPRRAPECERT